MPPRNETPLPDAPELDRSRVRVMRPNWRQLVASVVQISMSITYWKGLAKLSLDDLGLNTDNGFSSMAAEYLKLGTQYQIPPRYVKKLHSIRESCRNCHDRHGEKSPWKGSAFLIYRTRYLQWRAEIEELGVVWQAAVDEIIENYDEWVTEATNAHMLRIRQALCLDRGLPLTRASEIPETDIYPAVVAFRNAIPTPEQIRERSSWSWYPEIVETPEALTNGLTSAEMEQRRRSAEMEVHALEERIRNMEGFIGENAAAERAALEDQRQRQETERQIWQDAQERAAAARVVELDQLCADVAARIRESVSSVAQGILGTTSSGRKVGSRQFQALRDLVEDLRTLNIHNDPEVEAVAARVRAIAPPAGAEMPTNEEVETALREVYDWGRAGLYVLQRQDRFSAAEDRQEKGNFAPIEQWEVAPAIERFRRARNPVATSNGHGPSSDPSEEPEATPAPRQRRRRASAATTPTGE